MYPFIKLTDKKWVDICWITILKSNKKISFSIQRGECNAYDANFAIRLTKSMVSNSSTVKKNLTHKTIQVNRRIAYSK